MVSSELFELFQLASSEERNPESTMRNYLIKTLCLELQVRICMPRGGGKLRPVVILQDDYFDTTDSVTVCAFTTVPTNAPLFRVPIEPSENNGVCAVCRLVVDKATTVPKARIGATVGRLADEDEDIVRLNRAGLVFLGIAAPPDNATTSNWNRHRPVPLSPGLGELSRRWPSGSPSY